jgi:protein-S-isoprenylcysteine O-methyltransferase Ste14
MYIAGLKIPLSSPQWLEVLVVLSTADYIRYTLTKVKELAVVSESKGGRIRPESIPPTFLGRIITPIHGLVIFIPPLVYVGALVLNRFQPPEWMARFAFATKMVDSTTSNALRVVACAASFALRSFTDATAKHLGDQWHTIGRREKSRVVKTGPYAWVRHPGYSSVLLQEALWSIMFWSYVPLVALGITAFVFAVKMPIEESLIQKDDAVKDEYRKYMKKVPARILPYVW